MTEIQIAWLLFVAGVAASILLPYLQTYVETKQPFDLRYIVGRFLAVALLVAGQAVSLVDVLGDASPVEAFLVGFGISAAGRVVQKGVQLYRN